MAYPLQYSCLENSMDGGAWWATVHGVSKSQTGLSDWHPLTHTYVNPKLLVYHSPLLSPLVTISLSIIFWKLGASSHWIITTDKYWTCAMDQAWTKCFTCNLSLYSHNPCRLVLSLLHVTDEQSKVEKFTSFPPGYIADKVAKLRQCLSDQT